MASAGCRPPHARAVSGHSERVPATHVRPQSFGDRPPLVVVPADGAGAAVVLHSETDSADRPDFMFLVGVPDAGEVEAAEAAPPLPGGYRLTTPRRRCVRTRGEPPFQRLGFTIPPRPGSGSREIPPRSASVGPRPTLRGRGGTGPSAVTPWRERAATAGVFAGLTPKPLRDGRGISVPRIARGSRNASRIDLRPRGGRGRAEDDPAHPNPRGITGRFIPNRGRVGKSNVLRH